MLNFNVLSIFVLIITVFAEPEPGKRDRYRNNENIKEFTRPRITQEPVDKIANRDETSKFSFFLGPKNFIHFNQ